MPTKTKKKDKQEAVALPSHDLLSWEEAAAYLGPSVSARWVKRQYYDFGRIRTVAVGGPAGGKPGRRLVPRAELDRLVQEGMTQEAR
jgi:hypothetical protein